MDLLSDLIADVELGAPDFAGALAVFPVFGPAPGLEYVSFPEGAARGVVVHELPGGASVNDLLVVNPLDVSVLLFEGEQLRGAQQDRTVDGAVLVPGGTKVSVPVSCVERGRWEHGRHGEAFTPGDAAAFPQLRAAKSARMRTAMAAAAPARADQGEVWQMVGPDAMEREYEARGNDIDALTGAIGRRDGQTGALVAIGGRFVVLDQVSRPDAWAGLHRSLVRGYALDAVRRAADAASPTLDEANAWLAGAADAPLGRAAAPGLGERIHTPSATGLVVDDELIQLSVYA
jgi:hypothetical protein